MENLSLYAVWFFVTAFALVGAVDIYLVLCGRSPTVSRTILDLASDYPIIPFAVGVLAGHLLWPQWRG
jgi:uncharacterized membrane protein YedE/YeeE